MYTKCQWPVPIWIQYVGGILNCGLLREVIYGLLWNNPMQQSAGKANTTLASQEIPCTLWDQKVHYCVCNSRPLVTLLSKISLFQDLLYYFCILHFNIIFTFFCKIY